MVRPQLWLFRCDCGAEIERDPRGIKRGVTKSCGCLRRERGREMLTRHGHSRIAPEHKVWIEMRERCRNPTCRAYANYGGRGIRVCERWELYENFLADMGPRPRGTGRLGRATWSIERKDVNGHYEPGNCIWASASMQSNNRRCTRRVSAFGRTQTLTDWSNETGLSRNTIRERISRGWSNEDAVGLPLVPHTAPRHQRRAA